MNAEVKKKWVEALRSGEYEQGQRCLRRGDAYCCLGVLCDLHAIDTGSKWDECSGVVETSMRSYLGSLSRLPECVLPWAGLVHGPTDDGTSFAIFANDHGKTFPEIADLIDKHL